MAADKPHEASNSDVGDKAVIGTNSDLEAMRQLLDRRISELTRLAATASCPYWVADRLAALGRQRVMVKATLANRRIAASQKIVDLARWYNGDGALFRDAFVQAAAAGTPIPLSSSRL